jgi:hypothetical protein
MRSKERRKGSAVAGGKGKREASSVSSIWTRTTQDLQHHLSPCRQIVQRLWPRIGCRKERRAHPFSANSLSFVRTIVMSASTSPLGLEKLSMEKA